MVGGGGGGGSGSTLLTRDHYDQVTWLAGLGARLAVVPANFSKEMGALPALLAAARAQVRDEPRKRATGDNQARVRNATALLVDFAPSER